MPTIGTKEKANAANAKARTNEKEKAKALSGAQHVNLQHTPRIHVCKTNLQLWTSIQSLNKENFNASYVEEKGTLQLIAENSNHGKINAIQTFSGRLHEFCLQRVHQFTMFNHNHQRLHRQLQHFQYLQIHQAPEHLEHLLQDSLW
jgi:hypothetical protein